MDAVQATALTQAIAALTTFITGVSATSSSRRPTLIHELFATKNALDLGTRSGMEAFEKMAEPLPQVWDGTVQKFPAFVMQR